VHSLIDIGANLTHDSFDADRDEVIARAASVGVERLIITGASVAGSRDALQLAKTRPAELFATAGVHPHYSTDFDAAATDAIREMASDRQIVAIGECGLDYFRNFAPHDAQRYAFEAQLQIAVETGKPVFLHQRDAHDDFIALLKEYRPDISGGVTHCFTGNQAQLEEYLELDMHIGITGWICDERRGHDLQQAVGSLPLDRLLLETDAPYLLPRDLEQKPDGRRNEPSTLPHILAKTAGFMGFAIDEVAAAATRNTIALFDL
jgi:TatD DNase family protein